MRDDIRDLLNAGIYICAVGILSGGIVLGAGSLYQTIAATGEPDVVAEVQEPTRIAVAVRNAREIRAALATPIARPQPLPPMTAKPANAVPPSIMAYQKPKKLPKLSSEAMNAMAMDTPRTTSLNPEFDRHKVY